MRVIFTHEQQRRANETTSLPEIVVSLTAVRIGALDLGIGNVLAATCSTCSFSAWTTCSIGVDR